MTSSTDKPAGAGGSSLADRLAKLSPQQRELLLRNLGQRGAEVATDSEPTARAVVGQPLPLTPAQQQIWVFERLQPGSSAYLIYNHLLLEGTLDIAALEAACVAMIERHDMLRTGYSERAGEPVQTVVERVDFSIPVIDLSSLPEAERGVAMQREVDRESARPFDLSCPPLIRSVLLRLAANKHVWLLSTHHIMSDAWSVGMLEAEITQCYNAIRAGQTARLPEKALQYADVVLWQREPVQQQRISRQIEFWRDALSGAPGLLDLPTDFPRAAVLSPRGARYEFAMGAEFRNQVLELARAENTTVFVVLLSAFQALLARYSGDADIVVGTPVANRRLADLEPVFGLFVNTTALRGDLSGDPSFRELFARNRNHVLSALENSDAPLERVLEHLNIERAPGRTPLFQTMFVLQKSSHGESLRMDGLEKTWVDNAIETSRFELTMSLTESERGLLCLIDYSSDLFLQSTIERLAGHFEALLRGMVGQPGLPISQLSLITESERAELLSLGDGGPALAGEGETLHDLFALQAARTPEAIALVEPGPDGSVREWTYSQALSRANGIASALQGKGVGPGMFVAILTDRSAEATLAVLGVLAAGAAYLPLDPSNPDERLSFLLDDANACALLVPTHLSARASALMSATPALRAHVLHTDGIAAVDVAPAVERRSDDVAYVIYTSGSTGMPKGVVVEHRSAVNLVRGFLARHHFDGQRLLMIPPLIFDASIGDVFPILACGAALVLHPSPTELGPSELERFCREFRVTAIDAPTALWRRWSEGWSLRTRSEPPLPDLSLMMVGGESVPVEQVRRFAEITGRKATLCNHYGPTEASVCATLYSTTDGAEIASLDLPIGRPLPGVRVYLLDAHRQPVPRGVVGELYIGGHGVARGYLGAPELTAERFVDDAFSTEQGARMYRTGDLARWNRDDTLQFVGRRDHQVKLRGVRIELGEIDNALAALPGVQTAVTLLREDRPGDRRLVAYVVVDAENIDASALRAGLARRLPEAMLPSAFVFLPAMPLTANGKIDRRALPAPSAETPAERAIRAPQTQTEHVVLAVWREVIGREDLSTDDDFFASGGDSLSTLPLVFKLQAALGIEVPLSAVFSTPTISGLAESIDRLLGGGELDRIDLASRVVLPEDIDGRRVAPVVAPRAAPRSVLLTGATGFLGAYVLRDLIDLTTAEIACLVRADNAQEGVQRIRSNLEQYGLWRDGDEARLYPLIGDLSSPRLGLSESGFADAANRIDAIIHNGGMVNFLATYDRHEAANVGGTREVLRLATTSHLKPVQLVSTLGVYHTEGTAGQTVRESDPSPQAGDQHDGYNQSKWVSEQLGIVARSRGIPVAIHRPARVTGDARTGAGNPGDYFNSWLTGCIQLGLGPIWPDDSLDMTPVDYVARAIVQIMLGAGEPCGNYHYFNPHTLPTHDAILAMQEAGFPVREVEYTQWRGALLTALSNGIGNALEPFAGLFPEQWPSNENPTYFDCSATESTVAPLGTSCPPADRALLVRYLRFLQMRGFLPATDLS